MNRDLLLSHSRFLRSLAMEIVADAAAADDVVQEAWLAAVRHPPADPAKMRGWLAAVVRNLARRSVRGTARRRSRELASAIETPVPSSDAVISQRESIRAVVDAVFDLREPYRTTVLKRFYEDLKPAAIAREMNVPVETVRTRLKRALAELRLKLDARGDRRNLCLGLIGVLRPSVPLHPLLAGVLMMSVATKLLLLAGAVAAVATSIVLVQGGREQKQADPPPQSSLEAQALAPPGTHLADAPILTDRAAAEDTLPAESDGEGAAAWLARGVVRSQQGLPLPGASVALTLEETHPAVVLGAGTTDERGVYAIDIRPAASSVSIYLRRGVQVEGVASCEGYRERRQVLRADLAPDREWSQLDFLLEPLPRTLRGRVVDAKWQPVARCRIGYLAPGGEQVEFASTPSRADGRFEVEIGKSGVFQIVAYASDRGVGRAGPIDLDTRFDAEIGDIIVAGPGTLEGRVETPDGSPVPGLLLLAARPADEVERVIHTGLDRPDGLAGQSVRYVIPPSRIQRWDGLLTGATSTDADGRFRFSGLLEGRYSIFSLTPRPVKGNATSFPTGTSNILLVVEQYLLQLRIVDEHGAALRASHTVGCVDSGYRTADSESGLDYEVRPGETWCAAASPPGRRRVEKCVTIQPGQYLTAITLKLVPLIEEPGSVRIVVRDSLGQVVPDFRATFKSGELGTSPYGLRAITGVSGRPITAVPPGQYVLEVEPHRPASLAASNPSPYQKLTADIAVASGKETALELTSILGSYVSFTFHPLGSYTEEELPRGEIMARRGNDQPRKLGPFVTRLPDGSTIWGGPFYTDRAGRNANPLQPGRYAFRIEIDGFRPMEATALLEPGAVTEIELFLTPEE